MNIKGFKDINKESNNLNKDKKTTDSYTGGHSSGLNVENPDDTNNYKPKETIKLTVWKNGFQVDDGEFRDLNDEENKQFMSEVDKGYIPQELVKKGFKSLKIAMDDKKKEEYKPPIEEKKFKAFEGKGMSLSEEPSSSVGLDINKEAKIKTDYNKPTAKVNIRLHTGEVISQTFNTTNTLRDIRIFVGDYAPVNGTYDLVEGFPPKPLIDDDKTIEQLKIQGSVITQKLT